MSSYPHTRQLGAQAGVQLNPLRDNTDGFAPDGSDQVVALFGRFKRGRIDAPFKVNRGNLRKKLGAPESIRISALNEAYVQAYEMVNAGAYELVVSRLAPATAVNNFALFAMTANVGTFTSSANVPGTGYVFALKHLECFNEGIQIEVNAKKSLTSGGVAQPSKDITIRLREADGSLLYEFEGSLDPAAVDEFGKTTFIAATIAAQTDLVTIEVAEDAVIPTTADCYGKTAGGAEKLATTGATPLVLFTENGAGYVDADYDRAIAALENSTLDFGYIAGGGSQSVALLAKLAALSVRANRQFALDVPGDLDPVAAAAFIAQLNLDSHYHQVYWAPLETDDPLNGGKAVIGTSGFNLGRRCARNAQTNSFGLAPKNAPVAGKEWPLARTGVRQLYTPSEFELNDLALAKINPVVWERYNGGGRYVFLDSLTTAKTQVSYRKLISVAEMSSTIDDMVAKYAKEVLQLPMDVAMKRMSDFLTYVFNGARASGWLVPSQEEALGDKGWTFTVARNQVRPADRMDVSYGLHYDGVVRAIHITQTLSR